VLGEGSGQHFRGNGSGMDRDFENLVEAMTLPTEVDVSATP
jgi:hypothetical protein